MGFKCDSCGQTDERIVKIASGQELCFTCFGELCGESTPRRRRHLAMQSFLLANIIAIWSAFWFIHSGQWSIGSASETGVLTTLKPVPNDTRNNASDELTRTIIAIQSIEAEMWEMGRQISDLDSKVNQIHQPLRPRQLFGGKGIYGIDLDYKTSERPLRIRGEYWKARDAGLDPGLPLR